MAVRRVLVVEDNPANLALMEYLLRAGGYSVRTAKDGAEGVDAACVDPPDLILMDLMMPRLNGFDAFTKIRGIPALAAVTVIAVTALTSPGERDRILAHGFDGCLGKPITPDTFVPQIEQLLHWAGCERS